MRTSVNPGEDAKWVSKVWCLDVITCKKENGKWGTGKKHSEKEKIKPKLRLPLFTGVICLPILVFVLFFNSRSSFPEVSRRPRHNAKWIRYYGIFGVKYCPTFFSSGTVKCLNISKLVSVFHSVANPTSLHYSSQWPHLSCFPLALLLKLFIRISQDVSTSRSRNFLLPHHSSIRSCSWPFCFLFFSVRSIVG